MSDTRAPLGATANARNHAITGILAGVAANMAYVKLDVLSQEQWLVVAGALIGTLLGYAGTFSRGFTEALDGESLIKRLGKRLANWVG
jgi:hypothetical protein